MIKTTGKENASIEIKCKTKITPIELECRITWYNAALKFWNPRLVGASGAPGPIGEPGPSGNTIVAHILELIKQKD
jgi:hypothetical protein